MMENKPNSNTDESNMNSNGSAPKSLRLLTELMMRGSKYREEEEYDVFGGKVTVVFKPIPDQYYTPLMVGMMELSGMDEDELKDELEAAIEEAVEEDDAPDEERISLSTFRDPEMMEILKELCYRGIDAQAMDGDDEMLSVLIDGNPEEGVSGVVGGYLMEWGFKIMEISGNLMDAKEFRGGRNRV